MKAMNSILMLVGFIICMPMQAEAVFISMNDTVHGFDSITLDTETGLEWLDVNIPERRSPNDLLGVDGSNEFIVGGDFAGFRYANASEVEQFWFNGGIVEIQAQNDLPTIENFPGASNIISFVGAVNDPPNNPFPQSIPGFIFGDDLNDSNFQRLAFLYLQVEGLQSIDVAGAELHQTAPKDLDVISHWLVRDNATAVPEPATLILFSSGLVGAWARRRTK